MKRHRPGAARSLAWRGKAHRRPICPSRRILPRFARPCRPRPNTAPSPERLRLAMWSKSGRADPRQGRSERLGLRRVQVPAGKASLYDVSGFPIAHHRRRDQRPSHETPARASAIPPCLAQARWRRTLRYARARDPGAPGPREELPVWEPAPGENPPRGLETLARGMHTPARPRATDSTCTGWERSCLARDETLTLGSGRWHMSKGPPACSSAGGIEGWSVSGPSSHLSLSLRVWHPPGEHMWEGASHAIRGRKIKCVTGGQSTSQPVSSRGWGFSRFLRISCGQTAAFRPLSRPPRCVPRPGTRRDSLSTKPIDTSRQRPRPPLTRANTRQYGGHSKILKYAVTKYY